MYANIAGAANVCRQPVDIVHTGNCGSGRCGTPQIAHDKVMCRSLRKFGPLQIHSAYPESLFPESSHKMAAMNAPAPPMTASFTWEEFLL
jgi:hypothetical protein